MTCEPVGSSVYDNVLPASFSWKMEGSLNGGGGLRPYKREIKFGTGGMVELENVADVRKDVLKVKGDENQGDLIPILQHLADNESLDPGWHRTNERLARGIRPPKSLSTQLETWEKQLAVMEMALIAGTETGRLTQHRIAKILAHAWGREKGFHKLMVEKHCDRRGDLDRKKRVDAGLPMSQQKKANLKVRKRKRLQGGVPGHALYLQNVGEVYPVAAQVPAPQLEPAVGEEVNEQGMAEVVNEVPVAGAIGEVLAAEGVAGEPMAKSINEQPMAEMVGAVDAAVPYPEAPPPPLEEPAIEAMEEPSIEEMVTEDV